MNKMLCAATVFLGLAVLAGPLSAAEDNDAVLGWMEPMAEAVQRSNLAPCLVSRSLAIMHLSAFDAVNAEAGRYDSFAFSGPVEGEVDGRVAAIEAIRFSASVLFPSDRARFAKQSAGQLAVLRESVNEEVFARSLALGEASARANLAARDGDGSTSGQTYVPKNELGKWKRTPARYRPPELSNWGKTRPFVLAESSVFRLPPPPSLDSPEYAAALEEVRRLGGKESAERTAEQAEIARFWSCFSYTSTPAGHWYEIATRIARAKELSLLESARLMALLNLAMVDAGIACWDTKYTYELWRPVHAVPAAESDGNPLTVADRDWQPLLETPPHPEYVSGHASFSGAGARIMELFFDAEDGFEFETTSSSLEGVVRRYKSFDECSEEIGMSRVYGGIHFRFSNEGGKKIGIQVADYVWANALQPRR